MISLAQKLVQLAHGNAVRQQYRKKGYFVFRDALPVALVSQLAALADTVIAPHQGELLRQDGAPGKHKYFEGTRLISNSLAQPHLPMVKEMAPVADALRSLFATSALVDCLRKLDGANHYEIQQVLYFFAAQTTDLHIDSWGVDTCPPGYAHTLWIPLQDLEYTSGVPMVMPWPVGKVITEADLGLSSEGATVERYKRYHDALVRHVFKDRPEMVTAVVRKGDMLVWTSLSPHLTMPAKHFPAKRLSLQVLVRPSHLRHGTFIYQPDEFHTTRMIRVSDRIGYSVSEDIAKTYGIDGDST